MKRYIFLFLFVFVYGVANAQIPFTFYQSIYGNNQQPTTSVKNVQLAKGYYYTNEGWKVIKIKIAEVPSYYSGGHPELAVVAYYNYMLNDWTPCRINLKSLSRMCDSAEICEVFSCKFNLSGYGTIYL